MTPNQYRAAIAALGLSQVRAAKFLGIAERTSRSYALGEFPVPRVVAMLLSIMVSRQIVPSDLEQTTVP